MITRLCLALCLSIGLVSGTSFAGPADSLRGIRNKKCSESAEAAKQQLFDEMANSKTLCPKGVTPNQTDGWTCRQGGDCKKGLYRCNTQYRCGVTSAPTAASVPTVEPRPKPTEAVQAVPHPMEQPPAQPVTVNPQPMEVPAAEMQPQDAIVIPQSGSPLQNP